MPTASSNTFQSSESLDEGSRSWSLKVGFPFLKAQKSLKNSVSGEESPPTPVQALPDPGRKSSLSTMTLLAPNPGHPSGSLANVPSIRDSERSTLPAPASKQPRKETKMILRTSGQGLTYYYLCHILFARAHTHLHIYAHTCIHISTQTLFAYTPLHICTCTHTPSCQCRYLFMHICTQVKKRFSRTHLCAHTQVCTAHIYTWVSILCRYTRCVC